jgi:hypothetical protein
LELLTQGLPAGIGTGTGPGARRPGRRAAPGQLPHAGLQGLARLSHSDVFLGHEGLGGSRLERRRDRARRAPPRALSRVGWTRRPLSPLLFLFDNIVAFGLLATKLRLPVARGFVPPCGAKVGALAPGQLLAFSAHLYNCIHRPASTKPRSVTYAYPLAIGRHTRPYIQPTTQQRHDRSRVGTTHNPDDAF